MRKNPLEIKYHSENATVGCRSLTETEKQYFFRIPKSLLSSYNESLHNNLEMKCFPSHSHILTSIIEMESFSRMNLSLLEAFPLNSVLVRRTPTFRTPASQKQLIRESCALQDYLKEFSVIIRRASFFFAQMQQCFWELSLFQEMRVVENIDNGDVCTIATSSILLSSCSSSRQQKGHNLLCDTYLISAVFYWRFIGFEVEWDLNLIEFLLLSSSLYYYPFT